MNLIEIKSLIKELDPQLDEKEESFKVACLLLWAAHHGNDLRNIRKAFNPSSDVHIVRKKLNFYDSNLRKSGVWVGNNTNADWMDKDNGGIEFWCDVLVAEGLIARVNDKK